MAETISKTIKSIELTVDGESQTIVVKCDYCLNLKSKLVYGGVINLDLIFDENVKRLPGWVSAKKKFSGNIAFKNIRRETVREINFMNATTDDFSGAVDLANPKKFIATIKLIAESITLV
jgi:hypothetical protein